MRLSNHWITKFRERIGFSQYNLADMLGIARSNIAMHENGQRMISTRPMLQLSQLKQLMDEPQTVAAVPPITITAEQTDKMRGEFLYHARTKRYEAETMLRKIEAYEQKQLQLQQIRVLIQAMAKHHLQYAPLEWQVKWLALQDRQSSYKNFNEREATKHKMNQLRHTMLLKEAEEAERMAGEV